MLEGVPFKLPVYRNQTGATGADVGKIIVPTDTLRLIIRNDMGAETTQDVTVTKVSNGGRDIQWDNGTTGNLRTGDVVRVHQRHQYSRADRQNWTATLTELNPTTVKMAVASITMNGAVFTVGATEAAAANGIEPAFVTDLLDKINAILMTEGTVTGVVTGTAGTQVLTLTFTGLTFTLNAITATGATVVGPTLVP